MLIRAIHRYIVVLYYNYLQSLTIKYFAWDVLELTFQRADSILLLKLRSASRAH